MGLISNAQSTIQKASAISKMDWWREARFGMFIHYNPSVVYGKSEWGMLYDKVPVADFKKKLAEFNPNVAQYIVPNGFNRRVLAQFNLREAFAFCQLRSASNAHFSIRRVAQKMYEEMARVHPLLTKYMKLHDETWQGVEENYFTQV